MKRIGGGNKCQCESSQKNKENPDFHKTSIRLSKMDKQSMQLRMASEGYSLRQKSKWVQEAIISFLEHPQATSIVYEMCLIREILQQDQIILDKDIWINVWQSAIDVMQYGAHQEPPYYMEFSSSAIIRVAIIWRLSKTQNTATVAEINKSL